MEPDDNISIYMEHKFYFYIFDGKTGPISTEETLFVGSAIIDPESEDYYDIIYSNYPDFIM